MGGSVVEVLTGSSHVPSQQTWMSAFLGIHESRGRACGRRMCKLEKILPQADHSCISDLHRNAGAGDVASVVWPETTESRENVAIFRRDLDNWLLMSFVISGRLMRVRNGPQQGHVNTRAVSLRREPRDCSLAIRNSCRYCPSTPMQRAIRHGAPLQ